MHSGLWNKSYTHSDQPVRLTHVLSYSFVFLTSFIKCSKLFLEVMNDI